MSVLEIGASYEVPLEEFLPVEQHANIPAIVSVAAQKATMMRAEEDAWRTQAMADGFATS